MLLAKDALDTIFGVSHVAVGLLIAASHTVDTNLGLNDVDKVIESSAGGTNWSLDIVLPTSIARVKLVLGGIDLACDLNPARTGGPVSRKNKALREDLGTRSTTVRLVAEGNGLVLVGSNVSAEHGREEEAVAVGRVKSGDLTFDSLGLCLCANGQNGGGCEEESGSVHY